MMEYVALAGAGLSALNSINSGNNASKQSAVNAQILDQQANNLALQTGSQVAQIRRQGSQIAGEQAAGFAENGTGTGGSNALIQRSSAIDTELDAANADYNGRVQIADVKNRADAMRATAKAQKPGLLSILGSGLSVAGAYGLAGGKFGGTQKPAGITNKNTLLK